MRALLSPKELAAAVGVSESSIKRWVDEGRIEAHRTAGGHRRIALADAVAFLRDSSLKLVAPEMLGLPVGQPSRQGAGEDWPSETGERLFAFLAQGQAAAARGLLLQLYVEGFSPAEIFDGPLRGALDRLGQLWHASPTGIFIEHRAVQICLHAVQQLRALMPENENGPLAMGGTPSPDTAQMGSLGAAIVLADLGFHAVNLGPELPLGILGEAVLERRPVLVWVSVSHGHHDDAALERDIALLHEQATEVGAALAVGGLASPRCLQRSKGRFLRGQSMAELIAFVHGLGLIR